MGVVIVTGGLGTLGGAVKTTLQERGWTVVVVDAAPAPAGSDPAILGSFDLTVEASVDAAYARIAHEHGGIDALVNAAGGFVWQPMEDGSLENWDRMYAKNLRSAAISSKAALPHLLARGGAIVNVGAAAAVLPGIGMAPYAASKAGVRALTESLAEELRGRGVRVNAVMPTILDTPTNRAEMPDADTSGWVTPGAAARVIAFLLSGEAAAITGASIPLSLRG